MAERKQLDDSVMGLDEAPEETLKLISSDQESFTVSKKIALMSELVKTMSEGGFFSRSILLIWLQTKMKKRFLSQMSRGLFSTK